MYNSTSDLTQRRLITGAVSLPTKEFSVSMRAVRKRRLRDDGCSNSHTFLPGACLLHRAGSAAVFLTAQRLSSGASKDPETADLFFIPAYHGDQ